MTSRRLILPGLTTLMLLAACTANSDGERRAATPTASATASASGSGDPPPMVEVTPTPRRGQAPTVADARIRSVPSIQWRRMRQAGMIRPECPIQQRTQLRRVEVNHHTFGGGVTRGHVVVNVDVARSVARIFTRLFEADFPIRRMHSVERYGGDNTASLRADNTAAFNCRRADQINAPFADSPHANGRAIDINPVENPWLELRCDCWSPSPRHAAREPGPGKILRGGPVWRAFQDEGWVWQNIDVPDYMHFDTGYPSAPYDGPPA